MSERRQIARKKKRAVTASVQSVASILGVSLEAVMELCQRGRIKARRVRRRLLVDVMSPFDNYAVDYDSAFAYHQLLEKQGKPEQGTRSQ